MFSPLRNRFGIPGAISVIALVFAMLGGAYAASNDGGKADASAKAKRGPRGPKGPAGPQGPAGPAGPQGAAGANGAKGDTGAKGDKGEKGANGTNGTNGTPGADGKSVTFVGSFSGEEEGEEEPCQGAGGSEYEVEESETPNIVCNGAAGAEGSPWTAGGTLPPGATETGAWAFHATTADTGGAYVPISFSIPLSGELGEEEAFYVTAEQQLGLNGKTKPPECQGRMDKPTEPPPPPGILCVYEPPELGKIVNATLHSPGLGIFQLGNNESEGANRTGAFLKFDISGVAHGTGSWAVTGF